MATDETDETTKTGVTPLWLVGCLALATAGAIGGGLLSRGHARLRARARARAEA